MTDEEGQTAGVTVIVTSYNQARFIEQALDSVLTQTEPAAQLIVTDDGSTDGSQEVIERWVSEHVPDAIVLASPQNLGLPAMLNRAIPHIRGDFVAVLNGDDWFDPGRVRAHSVAFEGHRDSVGVVYSDLRIVTERGAPTGRVYSAPSSSGKSSDMLLQLASQQMIGMGALTFRTGILEDIGAWDESLVADDFDFLLRAARAGYDFAYLPGTFYNARKNPQSLTASRRGDLAHGRIVALRKHLGVTRELDRAIYARTRSIALALHGMRYRRDLTRHHLALAMVHTPSVSLLRSLLENAFHLPPGCLAAGRLRRGKSASAE